MDDTNSTASFEDIGERSQGLPEIGNADDDVPDVCYILQRREYGGAPVEVRRGRKPIEHDLGDVLTEKVQKGKKQPVLEIVTLVSARKKTPCYPSLPHYRNGYPEPLSPDDGDFNGQVVKSERTTMIIRSRHLINALAAIVSYYPGTSFTGSEVKIEAPYYVLIHHREALGLYKNNQPEGHDEEYASITRKHIDILLGYLDEAYGQQIREESERHARKTPVATHDRLWLLLRPGEIIYRKSEDLWTPYAISRVYKKLGPTDYNRSGPTSSYYANIDGRYNYSIDCWNYMYQGGKLTRKMHTFEIPHFSGEEVIHNLPVIPSQFFRGDNGDKSPSDVAAEHIRLGRIVWDLYKKPSYKAYDGDLAQKSSQVNNPTEHSTSPTGYMSGRVIIDGEGYERNSKYCPVKRRQRNSYGGVIPMNMPPPQNPTPADQLPYFAPRCGCRVCGREERVELSPFAVLRDMDPRHDAAPESDLFYHVLSKVIAGFLPGERCWGHFHVERLRDIQFDKDAFRYLVLDAEIKNTVRALTGKFASEGGHVSAWPNDFVKNKGQGRIFLLHGSPGVGKTCTAECVAELTHRPLLSLTSGDLRSRPDAVEQNLNYFLSLGERFGAIVLLDEADVYLGSRRDRDIERNGLVSVFLRALEYYRGVLFLTTNRVQAFDAAFTSRIHVALHYGALTDADRERIWSHGFERLEREAAAEGRIRVRVTTSAREYAWSSPDVRSLRWNGREIRNALQTAFALAETEARGGDEGEGQVGKGDGDGDVVLVTDEHLRAVARMSRGFKNFMRRNRVNDELDDEGLPVRRVVYDQDPSVSGDASSSSDDDS